MELKYKFVDFDKYCKTCVYFENGEDVDPCYDCLDEPVNAYSRKPVYWKGKEADGND